MKHDWIVLVTVSHWYDDLFQNWLHWFELLQIDIKLVMIAEDLQTHQKYLNESSFSVLHFALSKVRYLII